MRTALLITAIPCLLFGQVSVDITGVTSTQAVLQIRGATTPCTLELRETDSRGPVHPDVPSGTIDTARPDTLRWKDGTRIVTLGHQRGSLALAADTDYVGSVSGCATTGFFFHTATPKMGALAPRTYPWSADSHDRHDNPKIDWSVAGNNKAYVDPLTGLKMRILNRSGEWSYMFGEKYFGASSGGTNWTNPEAIGWDNPWSSVFAQTSTTDPVDMYVGGYELWRQPENLGIRVYGGVTGSQGVAANREINFCIVTDPDLGCTGQPMKVLLPERSTNEFVSSGSADGSWPATFPGPGAPFAGWNTALKAGNFSKYISAGVATSLDNGVLRILWPNGYDYFPPMKRGHKVYINDSSTFNPPCPRNLCTVESYTNAAELTLVEKITRPGNMHITVLPYSVRVWKTTNVGTARLMLGNKWAGNFPSATTAESIDCHPVAVNDTAGHPGHLCNIPAEGSTQKVWYWVPDDPNQPILYAGMLLNPNAIDNPGNAVQDHLRGTIQISSGPFSFDPNDGRVIYFGAMNNLDKPSLFRVRFRSPKFSEVPKVAYRSNEGGTIGYFDEGYVFTNLTPSYSPDPAHPAMDISSQILRKYPSWNTTLYPLNNIEFNGISSGTAYFTIQYNAKDIGPCFMVTLDVATGVLLDAAHTLDSSNSLTPGLRYGTCHTIGASYPTLNFLPHGTAQGNPAFSFSGPFLAKANAVLRNGAWSGNTALPHYANGSYDATCPTNLTAEQKDNLAVPPNAPPQTLYGSCVTFRFPGHPCNATPSPRETPANGVPVCSWNSAYSQPTKWQVGDRFVDDYSVGYSAALYPFGPQQRSSEYFRVLSVSDEPGGGYRIVAQRDSVWDYCCSARKGGKCVINDLQVTHANGWVAQMAPGTRNSCEGDHGFAIWNGKSADYYPTSNSFGGHFAIGPGVNTSLSFLSGAISIPDVKSIAELAQKVPFSGLPVGTPSFAGIQSPIGSKAQQYLSRNHWQAPKEDRRWSIDSNAILPSSGDNPSLGSRNITRVSGNIWRLDVMAADGTTPNYYLQPWQGWSGGKVLRDVSGPATNMSSAPDYSVCYALRSGECVSGSAAGQTFVKVPHVLPGDTCQVSYAWWAEMPCVYAGTPGGGMVRQFYSDSAQVDASEMRLLTSALAAPGIVPHYWQARLHPSGRSLIVPTSKPLEGIRPVYLQVEIPPMRREVGRTDFGGLAVQVPARPGATHARIRFGYNPAMECTDRSEACVTSESAHPGKPFAFAGDSDASPRLCTSGCTFSVPVMAGRIVYWRTEWLAGGSVVAAEEVQATVP